MKIGPELGGEVVIKIQAWTTGRAGIGGVAFAKEPEDVRAHAARMLAMKAGQFPEIYRVKKLRLPFSSAIFFAL